MKKSVDYENIAMNYFSSKLNNILPESDYPYAIKDFARRFQLTNEEAKPIVLKVLEKLNGSIKKKQVSLIETQQRVQDENTSYSFILVQCPRCHTIQNYQPTPHQYRKRKNCENKRCITKKGTRTKFTINLKTIIEKIKVDPPTSCSTSIGKKSKSSVKKTQKSISVLEKLLTIIDTVEGDPAEKETLKQLLTETNGKDSKKPFLKQNYTEGGGRVGGGHEADHFNDHDHFQKGHTNEKEHDGKVRKPPKGGMTISKGDDHFEKGMTISNDHFYEDQKRLRIANQWQNYHQYLEKHEEDFFPIRFGTSQQIADIFRQKMKPPRRKDLAKQYKLIVPQSFILTLNNKHEYFFYPRSIKAYREFLDFVHDILPDKHFKVFCVDFGSYDIVRDYKTTAIPRKQGTKPIDPPFYEVNCKFKSPFGEILDYKVSHDHSKKRDQTEATGPTKLVENWWTFTTQRELEFSLGYTNQKGIMANQTILMNIQDYLQNYIPRINSSMSDLMSEVHHNRQILDYEHRISQRLLEIDEKRLALEEQQLQLLHDQNTRLEDVLLEITKLRLQPSQKIQITNKTVSKKYSQDALLELIKTTPGITRTELNHYFGKYHGFVNTPVSRLLKKNKIREETREGTNRGRGLFVKEKK